MMVDKKNVVVNVLDCFKNSDIKFLKLVSYLKRQNGNVCLVEVYRCSTISSD